ncbi:hypothetical protein GCM10023194_37130 [Planotetraspora phitsanulokensis]|uniref:Uncharacterized protein n=1 Tax=Planotetraspora phitsanulokensis TaxID=575192 RepID=A0A8J3U0S7_9ACTN|nr:hypothetical protein [Planotetraspora phitsanulokensis]GII36160.1 hypothetical protein Pph01_11630 [Planotetraspora phitsanulokensis]
MAYDIDPEGPAEEVITCESARAAGAADGRNQALHQVFITDPTFQPPFVIRISAYFDSRQGRLLIKRAEALGRIEREAQTSSVALTKRVNEVQAISGAVNPDILALGKAGGDSAGPWGEVRPLTVEEADQERLEKRLREYNAEIETRVGSLYTASNNWLQCWASFQEKARLTLAEANALVACYKDGLLNTHQHAEEIARRWRPQEFTLRDDWFADPAAQLQIAIPRGVRDSTNQAWDKWLDLWHDDQHPHSLESGDSYHGR